MNVAEFLNIHNEIEEVLKLLIQKQIIDDQFDIEFNDQIYVDYCNQVCSKKIIEKWHDSDLNREYYDSLIILVLKKDNIELKFLPPKYITEVILYPYDPYDDVTPTEEKYYIDNNAPTLYELIVNNDINLNDIKYIIDCDCYINTLTLYTGINFVRRKPFKGGK